MHPAAIVRIEIRFSPKIHKSIADANASGDPVTLKKLVAKLVATYLNVLRENHAFIDPLKSLDTAVVIDVEGEVC